LKNESNKGEFKLRGRVVFFATGNVNKFNEARSVLSLQGLALGMLRIKDVEIQSDSLKEIASASVVEAFRRCRLPVFVEDAGLFIEALNGFPGPYAAYAYKTISNEGILRLLDREENRRAKFQSTIAYLDQTLSKPLCFEGESNGKITLAERRQQGKSGFGFDPIFQPNGSEKAFAEMTIEEKNGFSHRAEAVRKFAEWYKSQA
jgi:XTP/dITP diphosphohydrolase